ncbi:hypothetical protein [Campylobacter magnus]|uniref:hypothetical protein n=1 Tax=Campylobacter magnus TaxID=3026462 RepID=UPI00235DEFDC|nr:hypothetical protein [Campylobacter magnus]MDD0855365.1 hypothetical protein [Campylobacter magnus]
MMRPFASFGELVLTLSIVFVVFVLSYLALKALFIYSKSEKKSFKAAVISAFCAVILLFFSSCELSFLSPKIANILRYAFSLGALGFAFCAFAFIKQIFSFLNNKSAS